MTLSVLLENEMLPAFKSRDGQPLMVVGENLIVLKNIYDPNQHWFDFMRGVVFEPLKEKPVRKIQSQPIVQSIYARKLEKYAKLYVFELDQLCIPFPDRLNLSSNHFRLLKKAHFPGWELTADGETTCLAIGAHNRVDVEEWCRRNCRGFYTIFNNKARFQLSLDFFHAKVRFDG